MESRDDLSGFSSGLAAPEGTNGPCKILESSILRGGRDHYTF